MPPDQWECFSRTSGFLGASVMGPQGAVGPSQENTDPPCGTAWGWGTGWGLGMWERRVGQWSEGGDAAGVTGEHGSVGEGLAAKGPAVRGRQRSTSSQSRGGGPETSPLPPSRIKTRGLTPGDRPLPGGRSGWLVDSGHPVSAGGSLPLSCPRGDPWISRVGHRETNATDPDFGHPSPTVTHAGPTPTG